MRMLTFWHKLVSNQDNKLSSHVYTLLYNMHTNGIHENKYLTHIKSILIEIGLPQLWTYQNISNMSISCFKSRVRQSLQDVFIQEWYSHVDNDSMYLNYRMFKTTFIKEPYITLLPTNCAITIFRFRTSNNDLPVNALRYEGMPRTDRICPKCEMLEIGDEYHYIFTCPFFSTKRLECLPKFYHTKHNSPKYKTLFTTENKSLLLKLKHFICCINKELQH